MENSAYKAMAMAAGMLMAVLVIGIVVFTFRRLSTLPGAMEEDEILQHAAAFNTEYTVYDKKIMYGVDIISVLNKAKSNNDKYVQGNFLSGEGYNTDYIIDIVVILKSDLKESITVSYMVQENQSVSEREYSAGEGPTNVDAKDVFTQPSSEYCQKIYKISSAWNSMKLQTQEIPTKFEGSAAGTEYHLLSGSNSSIKPGHYTNAMLEGTSQLKLLLEQATDLSVTKKNSGTNKMRKGYFSGNGIFNFAPDTGWTSAIWKPAAYDLKTKKFKCLGEETVYSEKTGRIVKMVFEEVVR